MFSALASAVAAAARRVAAHIGTMGAALSVCNVPGQQASERLEPGQMELGLGIHGEPGAEKRPAARARFWGCAADLPLLRAFVRTARS